MTKQQLKDQAQKELMIKMGYAFVNDYDDKTPELLEEMEKQMRRVEKFLGWNEGSFARGA